MPPGIPRYPTLCIIVGIKITELVGEIIMNKSSHRELVSFLYYIVLLQINAIDLVYLIEFENMTKRVSCLFQFGVLPHMSFKF